MIRVRIFSSLKIIGIIFCFVMDIVFAQPRMNVVLNQRYADAGIVLN